MTNFIADMSRRKAARIAGLLYSLSFLSAFTHLFVRTSLIVPGDATTTARNILANELLFRVGFVFDLINFTGFLLLPLVLYWLLKPVNKNIALLMVIFVLASVPIVMLNMVNHLAALVLLNGGDYLTVFTPDQLNALVLLFLNLHEIGYSIGTIFFGLWLLPLGYLVFKSGYFPRVLGVLLLISCFGYLIDLTVLYLLDFELGIGLFTMIGEMIFIFWLLVKGANVPE